ncbi:hypothetical protein [Streptomyces sp. NPDC057382]
MGAELAIGFAVGIVTPTAVKNTKKKIKPWLGKKLKCRPEDKDD